MFSNIPGVQIIISLLKQYGISRLVVSPGTRNTALVHSMEHDSFFRLYSVVDERSAGFFALGLAEESGEPVCMTCTAATATCNYMPAIKEAYERCVPLVALTADQDTYSRFHNGDQNIDQVNMFVRYVNYAVDLPKVKNSDDEWYFNRCMNEALINLDKGGRKGPVQINFRMDYTLNEIATFSEKELPVARRIKAYNFNDVDWNDLATEIVGKKVAIICGANCDYDGTLIRALTEFQKKSGAAILSDNYGNVLGDYGVNAAVIAESYTDKNIRELHPDIIIYLGTVLYSPIKYNKELFTYNCSTWCIASDGRFVDGFRNAKYLFKCDAGDFFAKLTEYYNGKPYAGYRQAWKNIVSEVKYPNLGFTHFNAIRKFMNKLPAGSVLHASVLDAIRISNYFRIDDTVRCFANVGADGIDGALPTFLGQAEKTKKLAFLLVGDLSLMYGMDALVNHVPKNVRILVINNYAGSEFHKNFGVAKIPTIKKYISAGHRTRMESIATISDFSYFSAGDEEELDAGLDKLVSAESERPIILEVFTDAEGDARKLKEFWELNRKKFATNMGKIKNQLKKVLSEGDKNRIKRIIGR